MNESFTRRQFLTSSLLFFGAAACASGLPRAPSTTTSVPAPSAGGLVDLEARIAGRLGVFAVDIGSGRMLAHRADEHFAMCSTFKWVLAAAVLARVDRGE